MLLMKYCIVRLADNNAGLHPAPANAINNRNWLPARPAMIIENACNEACNNVSSEASSGCLQLRKRPAGEYAAAK